MRAVLALCIVLTGLCSSCAEGDPSELDGRSPATSVGVPAQEAGCTPKTTTALVARRSEHPSASALALSSHEFFPPDRPPSRLLVEDALDRGYLVVFYRPEATPEMVEHAQMLNAAFAHRGGRQPFLIVPMSTGTEYPAATKAVLLVVRGGAEEVRQECDAISESRILAFDSTARISVTRADRHSGWFSRSA